MIFLVLCCWNNTKALTHTLEDMKMSYQLLESEKTPHNYYTYFQYFPSNWDSFVRLFGFYNENPAPLYSDSYKFIDLYFECCQWVPMDSFVNKTLNITEDALYDADGVTYFKLWMESMFIGETPHHTYVYESCSESFIQSLSNAPVSRLAHFWHFYFDCPYIDNYTKIYEATCEKLQPFPNLLSMMQSAYVNAKKNKGQWRYLPYVPK